MEQPEKDKEKCRYLFSFCIVILQKVVIIDALTKFTISVSKYSPKFTQLGESEKF